MKDSGSEALVKHLGKQLMAVVEVSAELEKIGTLKNAREEAECGRDEAAKAALVAVGERDEALDELARVAQKLKENRLTATAVLTKAEEEARAVVDEAQVSAGGMLSVSRKKVDEMTRRLGNFEKDHVDAMARYAEEEAEARRKIAAILGELAEAKRRLG